MATTACVAALLAGCATALLPTLPTQLPGSFQHQPAASAAPAPDLQHWWTAFNDPALDALVDRALQQNLSLAQARSRLRQARLLAGRDQAQFRPTLAAEARTLQDAAAVDTFFRAGIDATWELGLFGMNAGVERTAQARLDQAAAETQAVKVSVVAEVVRQSLALGAARQEAAALQGLLALDEQLLALHAARRRLQLGSLDDQRAAGLRQAQLRTALAAPHHAANAAAQALAVLLAQTTPDAAWLQPVPRPSTAAAPQLTALALGQVPADLLRYRPDVRAAEAEVARASGELGMARAELYPRIVLGASYLWAYNLTQNRRIVINNSVPALGPSIDIPLFDWGRRRANADAHDEALSAALLAYRQTLVEAVGDTETALSAVAQAAERSAQLALVHDAAQAQVQLQATRARLGLASALERHEAERAALLSAQELNAARWARAQAVVVVYKALGGAPLEAVTAAVAQATAAAGTTEPQP